MPLTGPMQKFRAFTRTMQQLGTIGSPAWRSVMNSMGREVKYLIRDQFEKGIKPDGSPQETHSRLGRPGLTSARAARGAFGVKPTSDQRGVVAFSKNSKWHDKWKAHQEGHTFKDSKEVVQYRDKRGRLISFKQFSRRISGFVGVQGQTARSGAGYSEYFKLTKTGKRRTLNARRFIGSQTVGRRKLPPRPIYPTGNAIPRRWGLHIAAAIEEAVSGKVSKYATFKPTLSYRGVTNDIV